MTLEQSSCIMSKGAAAGVGSGAAARTPAFCATRGSGVRVALAAARVGPAWQPARLDGCFEQRQCSPGYALHEAEHEHGREA
jgi:hypothetical protein